jgi:nitrogen fixation protein FixH
MNQPTRSRWGIGIAVLYGSFVLFILAIVALASFQHFDLVEDHYYDKELVYQKHIDMINRTNALVERPTIRVHEQTHEVILTFPMSIPHDQVNGLIILYRPSGSVMDVTVSIKLDSANQQHVAIEKLPAGFWKAKVEWRVGDDEYYLEDSFFIN